jgi:hypothetical protein
MKEQIITSKSKKELMKFFLDDTLRKALEESCHASGNKMIKRIELDELDKLVDEIIEDG